jgi:putative cardiolipin synthase
MMRNARRLLDRLIAAFCIGLLLSGCAAVPGQVERDQSFSLDLTGTTSLGKVCESRAAGHAGLSGFSLLNDGRSAFLTRAGLADLAERSLDVQYFIWKPDMTGSILMERLVEAAKRGVRVRILIDDYYAGGHGVNLRALDAFPNVEVRLYNPFGKHLLPKLGRTFEMMVSFRRLNHRMHNKLFIVDNQVAVVGGRNIADSYFGADPAYNFRDFDLFTVGPVVKEISKSFDDFWNSAWAVPVRALYTSEPSAHDLEKAYGKLKLYIASHPEYPYKTPVTSPDSLDGIGRLCDELIWGQAEVASDSPGKNKEPGSQQITSMIKEFLGNARQEVLVVTPYLVPGDLDKLKKKLLDLQSQGIAVRILTNSLGSTDLFSTQVPYSKSRKLMVQCGVELYEMRPDAASRAIYTAGAGPGSVMGLHGKSALVDRSYVFIGTFNFDQRSAHMLVHSPELARKIVSAVEVDLQGQNSWRVSLASDCGPGPRSEGGDDLVWISDEKGKRTCLAHEPSATLGRIILRSLMGLLPIESQL